MPYAAYLLPCDIKINEVVYLEDLIEDYVGEKYKDNVYRKESERAIWDGKEFKILWEPSKNLINFIG